MHKYRIIAPSDSVCFMALIEPAIKTFGSEKIYIPQTGIVEVQTTMAHDEFWNFLESTKSGVGFDEFWEVNDGDAS